MLVMSLRNALRKVRDNTPGKIGMEGQQYRLRDVIMKVTERMLNPELSS